MVNAGLCKKAKIVFFFASLTHFDFFNYKIETSKCFKCKL